ncbi:MAG: DUF349 domain-containing protein [Muribaculaceae bacterium]
MELREMSESCENQEKDVTLETASDAENVSLNEQSETVNAVVEVPTASENIESTEVITDERSSRKYSDLDKVQIITALSGLMGKSVEEVREDVLLLKQAFYIIRKNELEAERQEFLDKGNEESAFAAKEDEQELKLKELLAEYKEKRAEHVVAVDTQRKATLERKLHIIDELKAIVQDTDNINKHYNKFQQLQQEFKTAGDVPAENVTDLWKSYQIETENFYDLLKINKDLRDYDFKKNLELKQVLCASAEELANEDDVIASFKKLQELHNKWRETGPVAKELREELWGKFKDASATINKKYQAFFEGRKEKEKENEDAKTSICEQIEGIDVASIKNYTGWDDATKIIISLQEQWKTLGFASRKINATLFTRFRKACDEFFAKKAEYFKVMKDGLAENLQKKLELCERAEALKDSTDWKKTSDEYVALQKEWKTVGPVVKKQSDIVWKRFIAACDSFFEEKGKQTSNVRQTEHANLKAKKEVIATIKAILGEEAPVDAAKRVRELMKEWQNIGHVPFKEKDKVYAEYQAVLNEAFDKLDLKETRARMNNFENSVDQMSTDQDKLYRERERNVRAFEQKRNELKTYENNMGFFNAKSKSGNSMLKEMERKIQNIKEELALLEKKIELIDSKLS